MFQDKPIKIFAINLKHRKERKEHIAEQFIDKDEFELQIVTALQ